MNVLTKTKQTDRQLSSVLLIYTSKKQNPDQNRLFRDKNGGTMKKIKSLLSVILVFTLLVSVISISASAVEYNEFSFSDEYKGSPYYTKLLDMLENSKDKTMMEKTLAVALSQEGYKNYSLDGIDIEQARADGLLWTGAELRMNDNLTGNTEYTRWAQRYIAGGNEQTQYEDLDWCAIFVSWCMYQAGYYDKETLKKYYYSYCAEPREAVDADAWITAFNMEQNVCWYTPLSDHKLDQWNWNTYYNRNVDPFELPYRPGGLVFFSWDTSGKWFDHVAIVVNYDKNTHVLTYTNGNSDGQVITREIDLDVEESYRGSAYGKNCDRIMGYGEYDEIKPLEQKEITADTNQIYWSKNSDSGIKIQTDSASKIASVYMDDEYLGSIIESNMVLHSGKLSIGKSELVGLDYGNHKMTLKFDDGNLDINLYILRPYLIGDADMDENITIMDVTEIQKTLAKIEVEVFFEKAADVDKQGLSISDATFIQQYLAKIGNPYNIGETDEG